MPAKSLPSPNPHRELINQLAPPYQFEAEAIQFGSAIISDDTLPEVPVRIPLKMMNRHGLITGATGTGKTVTLQVVAEQLSLAGVPSLLMDLKGDLSGLGSPSAGHKKIDQRMEAIGLPFQAEDLPVEFLTLSKLPGVKLRATVSEFGPQLFSKMLGLNETQTGIATVVFKYCDDRGLALVDLQDFRAALNYIRGDGKEEVEERYGRVSGASAGTILRKMLELEQQGGDTFFGEPSFDVHDLCRLNKKGKGILSILSLKDIQDRPRLFSTFMLSLLSEVYRLFPEEGDLEKPKLAIFIDEAHLIFKEASSELIDQLEAIIKLIRSKAVGIYFCTQNPTDIPEAILSQLGLKIQHSLRAFTAKDRKAIKLVAENFPTTKFYDIESLLTQMGIGEALITGLGPKGRPLPPVHTLLRAPVTRMGPLKKTELTAIVSASPLVARYAQTLDPKSAHEILTGKMESADDLKARESVLKDRDKLTKKYSADTLKALGKKKTGPSFLEQVLSSPAAKEISRTVGREISRGLLGAFGIKKPR
ncbi:MAG: helicase HerA-like domain-containing protein [Verrucomicrobiota bacterium]